MNIIKFKIDEMGMGFIELNGTMLDYVRGVKVHSEVGEPTTVDITLIAAVFGEMIAKVINFDAKEVKVPTEGMKTK